MSIASSRVLELIGTDLKATEALLLELVLLTQ